MKDSTINISEKAIFAAGCFWGVEESFRKIKGVIDVVVGYTGGHTENPTYQKVCSGTTGHAEAVEVTFNPEEISYEDLVRAFFTFHNPTTKNRQGPDVGSQYRSAVFYLTEAQKESAEKIKEEADKSGKYKDPIVTEVIKASSFYKAEEYHQQYLKKQGRGVCHI